MDIFNTLADATRPKTAICCDVFRKMIPAFNWMRLEDGGTLLMPYIETGGNKWRVNHCPSCGAEVRSVQITTEEYLNQSI